MWTVLIFAVSKEPKIKVLATESTFADARALVAQKLVFATGLLSDQLLYFFLLVNLLLKAYYSIDLDAMVPMDAVRNIKVPILLMHGGKNKRLAANNSYRICSNAKLQSQVWFVPDAKHSDIFHSMPEIYIDKLLEYYSGRLL